MRGTIGTGENEWFTPIEHIKLARKVLGAIDLDPATHEKAQTIVRAAQFFTKEDDGLKHQWHGRTWLNPPYAQPFIAQFVSKLCRERKAGRVTAAIMLTHNYTDTAWFREAASVADAICFTHGRIKFYEPDGTIAAPTQGQPFFYFGDDVSTFDQHFASIGFVLIPYVPVPSHRRPMTDRDDDPPRITDLESARLIREGEQACKRWLADKQVEPAKYALQQYLGFLQQKNFKAAYNIVSDARKEERKRALPPGADDYSAYVSAFDGTEGYKNFTYELLREESENERRYRITFDVQDRVPRNTLFESGGRAISSFSGSMDRAAIFTIVLDNIKEYYLVPDSAIPAIQEYVATRTVEDLMDPTFIAKMMFDLRTGKNIELQQSSSPPSYRHIWRYFIHDNVVMINQGGEWKIRSGLNNPVIALYK